MRSLLRTYILSPLAKSVDFLVYIVIKNILRYRRNVILDNLNQSGFSSRIGIPFYKHLAGIIRSYGSLNFQNVEVLKSQMTLSPEAKTIFASDQSLFVWTAHYGHWERMAIVLPHLITKPVRYIYQPQSPLTDKYVNRLRSRGGAMLVSHKNLLKVIQEDRLTGLKPIYVLLIDQGPIYIEKAFWVHFLNRSTPFLSGPERIARRLNMQIVFALGVQKKGRTQIVVQRISRTEKLGTITKEYAKQLERYINAEPQYWLWSHRRWKRAHRIAERAHDDYLLFDK